MIRIDRLLVERGLAASRNQAQEWIEAGRVVLVRDGAKTIIRKASQTLDITEIVEVLPSEGPEYVSRGGIKMRGALDQTGLDVRGFFVLDVGISTGGFSDCLLQAGASEIVGVDVGHGQLASRLLADSRVHLLEGINARELSKAPLVNVTAGRQFDLIVVDVSFISLRLVLPEIILYLKEQHYVLALVKPQFEVGREGLGKNGIVKDKARLDEVREKILALCDEIDLTVENYFASPIEGSDGNKEFFVFARKG